MLDRKSRNTGRLVAADLTTDSIDWQAQHWRPSVLKTAIGVGVCCLGGVAFARPVAYAIVWIYRKLNLKHY
jgi:hypothetical protein